MGVKKYDYSIVSDYIELEKKSEIKHEYEEGEIFAMSGGSISHGILCGNIYTEIRKKLKDNTADCRVFGSEIRVRIEKKNAFVYPDTMVVCGDIQVSDEDENSAVNPILIVEVLSKSTAAYDRGDKFYKYRQIDSFQEYVLIDQEKAVVEIFYKKENNVWEIVWVSGLNETFLLQSIDASVRMEDLYQDVELS